jgi:hypothetical protein
MKHTLPAQPKELPLADKQKSACNMLQPFAVCVMSIWHDAFVVTLSTGMWQLLLL